MEEKDSEKIYLQVLRLTTKSLTELNEGVEFLTPQQTDLYRAQLAALYGLLSDELARLEQRKAQEWLKLKTAGEKPLSDKMTDTTYDATPDGQRRLELKFKLKAMEKMISALAGRLRRFHEEIKNQY